MSEDDSSQGYSARGPEGEPGSPPPGSSGERPTPPFRSSWLFETEEKLNEMRNLNPRLRTTAELLHTVPSLILSGDFLAKKYEEVMDDVRQDLVPLEDAVTLLVYVTERVEALPQSTPSQPPPVDDRLITAVERGTAATEEVVRRIDQQTRGTQSEIARVATATEEGTRETRRVASVIEEQTKREEPEIARLEVPGTAEECVALVESRLFDLLQKAITEKKQTKNYEDEYKAIQRMIERMPRTDAYKGEKSVDLSRHLASRFPEGVFLREKLTLLTEAMKNLTDRTVEVAVAEGSLMKLGVEKPETPLAKEMLVMVTNITPADWYVLTHTHTLFPEAANVPETRLDIQAAWDAWRGIGDLPYRLAPNGEYKLETILDDQGNLIPKGSRKVTREGITLEQVYTSDTTEALVKAAIARSVASGQAPTPRETRSELMAWCFLKVGLTFDMWDRERWKIHADNGARDLIWFPWRQMARARASRAGEGVLDTAGSYWAEEGQGGDSRRPPKDKIEAQLRENEGRAIIRWNKRAFYPGTVIGDFWNSSSYKVDRKTKENLIGRKGIDNFKLRLSSCPRLENIPWLEPGSEIEEGTYNGYFGYSMAVAKGLVDSFMKSDWKIEELKLSEFWKRETDLLVRLRDYCPVIMTREKESNPNEKGSEVLIQGLARTFVRGVLWKGSYLSQPDAEFLTLSVPPKGIYTFDDAEKIKRAVQAANFLNESTYNALLKDMRKFKYYSRGAPKPIRR